MIADSETLCSSFFALEQMIFYMAHETTTLQLDSKEILQVHSALQGAVSALLYFLSGVADSDKVRVLSCMSLCKKKLLFIRLNIGYLKNAASKIGFF